VVVAEVHRQPVQGEVLHHLVHIALQLVALVGLMALAGRGAGSGGTLNILGSYATSASAGGSDSFSTDISGGSSIFGNASYGAGAMGIWVNAGGSGVIAGGGAGGTAIEVISGLTAGGTVAVTVGAAGTGSSANGYAGVVIVEY